MFDIGFSELLVIAVVALIVIGPERLPRVARTVGLLTGRMRRYVGDIKADINRELQLEELKRLQQEVNDRVMAADSALRRDVNDISQGARNLASDLTASINPSIASSVAGDVNATVAANITGTTGALHEASPAASMNESIKSPAVLDESQIAMARQPSQNDQNGQINLTPQPSQASLPLVMSTGHQESR